MSYRTSFEDNLRERRSKNRREFEDRIEREEEQKRLAPILAAQAEQNKLRAAIRDVEREEIVAGRKDTGWVLPESVRDLRMSKKQAIEFNNSEAEKFGKTEEYQAYRLRENSQRIIDYLLTQDCIIADAATFRAAFIRLRDLGLLTEKPPEPVAPAAEPETPQGSANIELNPDNAHRQPTYPGIDGREYTERQIYLMSSTELKQTFGMFGPRLPKFSDVIKPA